MEGREMPRLTNKDRRDGPPPLQRVRSCLKAARLQTKVWLDVDGRFVMGDGGLRLLSAIAERGSLVAAVRETGWSYRHAWGYLRRAENAIGEPLTRSQPGKGSRRGTALTECGALLLERLLDARARVDAAVGPSGPSAGEVARRGRSVQHADRRQRARTDLRPARPANGP